MAEVKERAEAERVLAPKLAGTLALAQVVRRPAAGLRGALLVDHRGGRRVRPGRLLRGQHLPRRVRPGRRGLAGPGGVAELGRLGGGRHGGGDRRPGRAPGRSAGTTVTTPVDHPVLTTRVGGPDRPCCTGWSRPAPTGCWTSTGSAGCRWCRAPGTWSRCAPPWRRAARAPAPEPAVELRDVVFLEPFAVPDGTVAQYRVELTPPRTATIRGPQPGRRPLAHPRTRIGRLDRRGRPRRAGPRRRSAGPAGRRRRLVRPGADQHGDLRAALGRAAEHYAGDGEELARIEAPAAAPATWRPGGCTRRCWTWPPRSAAAGARAPTCRCRTAGWSCAGPAGAVLQPPAAPGHRHRRGGRRRPVAGRPRRPGTRRDQRVRAAPGGPGRR